MKTQVMEITPEMAKKMLEKNSSNRPISEKTVKLFAEVMKRGEWMLTHQGIAFSNIHELIDGQHRLSAVVLANIPIKFMVTTDCDQRTFKTVDIGLRRTNGHILAICDIPNYNRIASGITSYFTFKKNLTFSENSRNKEIGLTPTLLLDEYYNNKELYQKISSIVGRMYSKFRAFRQSFIFGFMCYAILEKKHNFVFVENFMWALVGENMSNYHNANILFHVLVKDIASNKKLKSEIKQNMVFKAFNYDYEGREMKLIKYDQEREGKVHLVNAVIW